MRHYTILLVDYEPRSIERTKRPLAEAGFKIEVATDGLAALEAFAKVKPDLVLIEAMLPKKHGFEVCQELKKTPQGKRTPILITTAVYKGRKYRSQALHIHGCDEYVEKPIADDDLLALVRRFLESSGATHGPAVSDASPAVLRSNPETRPAPPRDPDVIELIDDSAPEPPPRDPPNKPPKFQASFAPPAVRVEKKPATPAAPKAAPAAPPSRIESAAKVPWRTGTSAVVGDLTEDEIMARLDAILPSDSFNDAGIPPEPPAEPSASSMRDEPVHAEPIHDDPAPLAIAVADLPVSGELEAAAHETAGDEPEAFVPRGPAAAGDVAAIPIADAIHEQVTLEPSVAEAATDLQAPIALQRPKPMSGAADVVPFDAGRTGRRGKRSGSGPRAASATPAPAAVANGGPAAAFDAEPRRPVIAARAVTEPAVTPRAEPVASFSGVEEPAVRRGLPLWAWLAGVAALAGGFYFVVYRNPAPAAPDAPTVAEVVPPPTAPSAETGRPEPGADPVVEVAKPAAPTTPAPPPAVDRKPPVKDAETKPAAAAPAVVPPPTKAPVVPEAAPRVSPPPRVVAPATSRSTPAPQPDAGADVAGLGVEPVPVQIATPSQTTTKRSVQTGDLVALSEVDFPPVAVSRAAPQYTPRARLNRQQGTVVLNLLVDETGRVVDVQILRAIPGSDLDEAAAKAAKGWTFKPALKDGVNVKVWKAEQITFRL